MIIRINDDLKELAQVAGKSEIEISEIIAKSLIENEIIGSGPELYGAIVKDVNNSKLPIKNYSRVLIDAGLPKTSTYLDKVMNLQLFGENDCPECGGLMYHDQEASEYEFIPGSWENPPEQKLIKEVYTCIICGYSE